MSTRRIAAAALVVLASLCVVLALLAGYARTAILDSGQFANRATAALGDQPVRDLIATKITDEAVLRANRDLVAVRPLVQSAASAIVGSSAFRGLFHKAVRDLHRTVFTHDRNTATLTLADVGVLLAAAIERFQPDLAEQVPVSLDIQLDTGTEGADALDLGGLADGFQELALVLAIAALLLMIGGVLLTPDRRRGVVHAGIGVAVAGAVVVVAYQVGRSVTLGAFSSPDEAAAAGAVFDHFLQDLRTWALVMIACGTVAAAAAASLLRPVDVRRPLRRAWDVVVAVPATPWRRALRAIAFVVAGVLIIVERRFVLEAALVLVGVFVLYQGVEELLRMIAERTPARPAEGGEERPRRVAVGPLVAGTVAVAIVALIVAGLVASGGTRAASAIAPDTCNGHAELCDRTIDEVAFAGTHNAMSAATNDDWLFAQQERFLGDQLRDGVHALLIDAYHGQRIGGNVRTNLAPDKTRADLVAELGEEGVEAAERIRDRIVGRGGEPGPEEIWLCHGFCELGAAKLVDGLREVRDFVVSNPHEVLIIVIQDEGPTPAEIAGAFESSGLMPYVYTGPAGPPWPTLRELIDSGERVIVMAEDEAGGDAYPWYHAAYELMQETPYHFTKPGELSCAENRGPADASLFLLNHWIDTSPAPRPSNAAKVNAYDVLLARARECQRERGLMPNVIAVDFYRTGDLLRVVDTLNGVGEEDAP